VNVLHALGVNFLMDGKGSDNAFYRQPVCFFLKLAQSNEARLRLSLIPPFLEYPEYSSHVRKMAKKLDKLDLDLSKCCRCVVKGLEFKNGSLPKDCEERVIRIAFYN